MVNETKALRLQREKDESLIARAVEQFCTEFKELDIQAQVAMISQFKSEASAKIYLSLPTKELREA